MPVTQHHHRQRKIGYTLDGKPATLDQMTTTELVEIHNDIQATRPTSDEARAVNE